MRRRLVRIEAPSFVAGVVFGSDGVSDRIAPILKKIIGTTFTFNALVAVCNSKRWDYQWIDL